MRKRIPAMFACHHDTHSTPTKKPPNRSTRLHKKKKQGFRKCGGVHRAGYAAGSKTDEEQKTKNSTPLPTSVPVPVGAIVHVDGGGHV